MITNSSAGVVGRHDYMPFGEELGAGIGGRTVGMGFGAGDGVRQKFTSKERDNETGLDFFGARYFASTQGRFTTPDRYMPSAEITNPQTWNRYSYVLNNPLRYIDPTGLAYSDLDQAQRTLFQTYADQYNKANKTKLSSEEVYNTLDESQQANYEAITLALEKTQLTDKDGKSLGNALSLVQSVNQILGENRGGDTHARLYVTLTNDATTILGKSTEFKESGLSGFFGLHGKYSDSFRQRGLPSIQISFSPKAKTEGDIDIDYRSSNIFKREGHGNHYNSDVRQVGPEKDNGETHK